MKTIITLLLIYLLAIAIGAGVGYVLARLSRLQPPSPHYTIKHFCADHPDVCKRGSRMVRYTTPTPIPQQRGMVVVLP